MCVCVCVCVRERERHTQTHMPKFSCYMISVLVSFIIIKIIFFLMLFY